MKSKSVIAVLLASLGGLSVGAALTFLLLTNQASSRFDVDVAGYAFENVNATSVFITDRQTNQLFAYSVYGFKAPSIKKLKLQAVFDLETVGHDELGVQVPE